MFEGVAFHVFVHTMLVPAAANVSGNVGNYTCNIRKCLKVFPKFCVEET